MSVKDSSHNEEIDLLGLAETIWNGKLIILSFVTFSFLAVFGFNFIKPNTSFVAITEIKPITSVENGKYRLFNSHIKSLNIIPFNEPKDKSNKNDRNNEKIDIEKLNFKSDNFFQITPKLLLNLFLEQIEEGSILERGINKFKLINKDDYSSETLYKEAVVKLASEVQIRSPKNVDKDNKIGSKYHTINFEYNDLIKWKNTLEFAIEKEFLAVQKNINDGFVSTLEVAKQNKKFKIEDLNTKINLALKNYDQVTSFRLAFLKEQALIARRLKVKKVVIDTQLFKAENNFITNVTQNTPFYLRGYEAIEAEIKLIQDRSKKINYIPEIAKLKQELEFLKSDKFIERAEELFKNTPVAKNIFKPVIVKVASTTYQFKDKSTLYYMISIIIGGIMGVIFVIFSTSFKNRHKQSLY